MNLSVITTSYKYFKQKVMKTGHLVSMKFSMQNKTLKLEERNWSHELENRHCNQEHGTIQVK